ncbi:InlB B-repeat-containing protein, partial [Listeria cornellensis]|uniref:InlB B-repeat-containing protein n=1 Tax=Listeria cornellensis TaxID=1494961 RepID=UPI0011EA5B89
MKWWRFRDTSSPSITRGEYVTEPAVPKRAGYLFQGWQGSVDGEEIMWDFNQDTVSDQDMTLTAVWKQA